MSSGLKVGSLREVCLQKIGAVGVGAQSVEPAQPTGQFYAPFALGGNDTKVQMQSGRLKTALEKSSALQSTIPTWGQLFWQAVKNEDDLYGLEQAVRAVLLGHGYIGAGTVSPPRVDELKRQLAQLETLGGPPHGSGGSLLRVSDADRVSDPEQMAWHLKLPADLQRAGPEIYRNIRSEGVTSVRQWVNEQHPGLEQKSSPQYQDLFTTATIVDYEVADCRTEGMLMQKLATSDALEIHLRKLGAFIYLRRTKDKTGANRILGIKAPGTNTDIAPKWLLDDANLHSKTEFQRQERGAKASRYEGSGSGQSEFRQRRGGGRGKGGGKGGRSSLMSGCRPGCHTGRLDRQWLLQKHGIFCLWRYANKWRIPMTVFVSPRYLRLAMGGSHSVYILMRINLQHVGQALFNYATKLLNTNMAPQAQQDDGSQEEGLVTDVVAEDDVSLGDQDWVFRQHTRRQEHGGHSGYTVESWCEAVRRSQHTSERTFVVVHMFAGERRPGDIQEFLEKQMDAAGLKLLMLSVDLAEDPLWDFRRPSTVHAMLELAEEGLIDVWIGGPPCSTVARSRHVPLQGGPRPLRFRWALWGRGDLRPHERERVEEANDLWVNFWMMCDAVSLRGGAYLMEHPADPGMDPYPSMWLIPELVAMEERCSASRVHFHQCPFGGISPKLTTFSGNVLGLDAVDGVRCRGESATHVHGKSIGRAPDGSFYTRRLQTYPAALCEAMALMIFKTLQRMSAQHTGPTGALTSEEEVPVPKGDSLVTLGQLSAARGGAFERSSF